MSMAGSMAASMAGSMAGSMAQVDIIDVASLAGAAYAAHYRWDAYTPGTGSDIAAATNLQGVAERTLDQSTASQRPVLNVDRWAFNAANAEHLDVAGMSAPACAIGDHVSILAVVKPDTTGDMIFHASNTTSAQGILIDQNGGNFRVRAKTGVADDTIASMTGSTSKALFRGTTISTECQVAINGTPGTPVSHTAGGLTHSCIAMALGAFVGATTKEFDGDFYELVLLSHSNEATLLASSAAVEAFLITEYGL